ncbi:hypothetical protein K466DRAFT_305096 [Polyporus arcularius HHB13444]|uniref:Uncharacterized protein n=1 Tax=Polyporus arcularius HHB13444 TaxID=1314778 RepID=A0A5C3NY04_9APHY|nr:hypothetical protein K466DRAFT_305096 [Polyporus arcularius HHB13444]
MAGGFPRADRTEREESGRRDGGPARAQVTCARRTGPGAAAGAEQEKMHARRSDSGEREERPGAVGQRARQYHRTQHTGRKLERGKKQQRGREGGPGPHGSDRRREFCGRALGAGDVSERAEDTRTFSSSQVLAPSPRLSGSPLRLLAVLAVTTCTEALHRPCPVHNLRERARQRRRRASSPPATDDRGKPRRGGRGGNRVPGVLTARGDWPEKGKGRRRKREFGARKC